MAICCSFFSLGCVLTLSPVLTVPLQSLLHLRVVIQRLPDRVDDVLLRNIRRIASDTTGGEKTKEKFCRLLLCFSWRSSGGLPPSRGRGLPARWTEAAGRIGWSRSVTKAWSLCLCPWTEWRGDPPTSPHHSEQVWVGLMMFFEGIVSQQQHYSTSCSWV